MSHTNLFIHIVFCTKHRKPCLRDNSQDLYRYINGIAKSKGVKLIEINGTLDHLHLLIDIHPKTVLADLIQDIKASSSKWLKLAKLYPQFIGWAEGYGAFSVSYYNKETCINYIKRQKEHHKPKTSREEYLKLAASQGIEIDEKYMV